MLFPIPYLIVSNSTERSKSLFFEMDIAEFWVYPNPPGQTDIKVNKIPMDFASGTCNS